MHTTDEFIDKQGATALDDLKEFLRIPSISTVPDHNSDCRAAADWLAAHFRTLGCPRVELSGSDTHPVVIAEGPAAPGRPTVLVYGHYDVQPADPLDEWKTPPFEPTERDGNLYARGATDDKGQVFAVIKAFEAVSKNQTPPVNVRFLVEGQEESGGGVIEKVVSENQDLVKADAVLVSDMPYYAPGWPAIYTALRGLYYCEVTVRTLRADLHSGMYGGVAPNAHETLIRMLAQLKGKSGRIRIPELYDSVKQPSKTERKAWRRLPFQERKFLRDELGAKAMTGLQKASPLERMWALPTLDIHGITGGYTGAGAKTVIPAVATAKISLRLVPNQRFKTVGRQLKKALKELAPGYADVSIRFLNGADPIQTDPDSRPVELMSEAFKEVEGRAAVPIRSGGSIPIVGELGKKKAPVVLAGLGLPDDGLHAPNEKIGIEQFWTGIRVFGRFFEKMGTA